MQKQSSYKKTSIALALTTSLLMLSLSGCASKTPYCEEVKVPELPPSVIKSSQNEKTYYSEWQALVSELQKLLPKSKQP